jgi:branched-chain amino acid transport system substrate-binding protein
MSRGKLFKVAMIGLIAVMLITGCAQEQSSTTGPITIGVIAPMTGAQQFEGQLEVNSVKMAVDEVNAAGGLLGRTVTLIIEDTQAQPAVAVSTVEKLITKDKIVALQGAQWSSETKAIMPLLEKYGVPAVTAISTAPDITEGNLPGLKWTFRVIPHDGMAAGAVGIFLSKDLSAKSIAFLVKNDDWGRQGSAAIKTEFEKSGGKVVALEYFEGGETNFLPQSTKIMGLKPDAVVLVAQAQDGSMIAKQIKEIGFNTKVVGLGAFASSTFIDLAKTSSEGIYGIVQYTDAIDTPENKAFVQTWTKRYPQSGLPDKYAWAPYTATKAIFEAIKLANSSDPAKIRDALEKISFNGLTGEIKFDAKHQAHPDNYITQIVGGKVKLLTSVKSP